MYNCNNVVNVNDHNILDTEHTAIILGSLWRENYALLRCSKSSFLIFSNISLILTDCPTIYVAKTISAAFLPAKKLFLPAKTIFATPVLSMEKNIFPPTGKNLLILLKRGVPLCRKSWLKSAWNKHGYFNVTGSTMPIFVIEIVIEFSERAVLDLKNSDWNRQENQS